MSNQYYDGLSDGGREAAEDYKPIIRRLEAELAELRQSVNARYWEGIAADNAKLKAELAEARARHVAYLDRMGPILDPIRRKRATGEPARSDFEEVEMLVRHSHAHTAITTLRAEVEAVEHQLRVTAGRGEISQAVHAHILEQAARLAAAARGEPARKEDGK